MWIEFKQFGGAKRNMDNQGGNNNRFSVNFLSLQLQLKTLLEEAGGDELVPFLDSLATLNRSEQKIVLKVLTRAITRFVESTPRYATSGDLALKQFEDELYNDLTTAIQSEVEKSQVKAKIEVLSGGKNSTEDDVSKSGLIDLEAARRRKRNNNKNIHVLN